MSSGLIEWAQEEHGAKSQLRRARYEYRPAMRLRGSEAPQPTLVLAFFSDTRLCCCADVFRRVRLDDKTGLGVCVVHASDRRDVLPVVAVQRVELGIREGNVGPE